MAKEKIKFISTDNLSESHFVGVIPKGKSKPELQVAISRETPNLITVKADGLHVDYPSWGDIKSKPTNFLTSDGNQFLTMTPPTFTRTVGMEFTGTGNKRFALELVGNGGSWQLVRNDGGNIVFPTSAKNEEVAYKSLVEEATKISPISDNILKKTSSGLYVPPPTNAPIPNSAPKNYPLTKVLPQERLLFGQTVISDREDGRRMMYFVPSIGLGIIHLDFTTVKDIAGITEIAKLPEDAPVPINLIENQTSTGGTVWLTANNRSIRAQNIPKGNRVIIDLVGFFRLP